MGTFPYGPLTVTVSYDGPMARLLVKGPSGTAEFEQLHGKGPITETARGAIEALYNKLAFPISDDPWSRGMRAEAEKIGLEDLTEAMAVISEIEEGEPELSGPGTDLNLKRILMELGNELVTKHGYEPVGALPDDFIAKVEADKSTGFITTLTMWLNAHPEAQEVLKKMGVAWPVVRGRGRR